MEQDEPNEEIRAGVVSLGTDAMLELEEFAQGIRQDVPALSGFFSILRTPDNSPPFAGNAPISMLADIRAYPVLRDAAKLQTKGGYKDFQSALQIYLSDLEAGIIKKDSNSIAAAKTFCSSLVKGLIAKDMDDLFSRKEASDSRYMTNALI